MKMIESFGWFLLLALLATKTCAENDTLIVEVDDEEDVDHRRPVWNIAHMVNAIFQVDYYLNLGANSLEFDIAFRSDGRALYTFHGIPCDCFRNCLQYEDFGDYIDYMRHLTAPEDPLFRKELILLFMDLKVSGLSPSAQFRAGEDVAMTLLDRYWIRGTSGARAYIIFSLPSIRHANFIRGIKRTLQAENATFYEEKIGYDFSGNEDLYQIQRGLEEIGIADNVWQGDGITNCLPRSTRRLIEALDIRNKEPSFINKVYWWTVDKLSTIRRTLSLGVDGLITNYPQSFIRVLNEDEYSGLVRLATYEDNPWKKRVQQTASLTSLWPEGRSGHLTDPTEPEEILYNS